MSTIEFTCSNCSKTFRVRSEFAGKTTRCPGCSSSITIGSAGPAAPKIAPSPPTPPPLPKIVPPLEREEEPLYYGNWKPALTGLKREQTAVLFVGIQLLLGLFGFCVGSQLIESLEVAGVVWFMFMLPGIIALFLSFLARITSLRVPKVCGLRKGALASLLCSVGGIVSLILLVVTLMMSLSSSERNAEAMRVAFFGFAGSGLAATAIFFIYISQLGIYFRAEEIGKQIGNMAFTIGGCLIIVTIAVGFLGSLVGFFASGMPLFFVAPVVVGVLVIAGIILAFQYHRLLGLAQQVIQEKTGATRDS